MTDEVVVSVVMPVYNEERYIEKCVDSLLLQDYPKDKMEWIFVDGCSTDKTVEILESYREKFPNLVKVLNNPHKIVPYAMNIGIVASCGKYIVRLDAHADYATDYISKCIYYLETTDAENVGGVAETVGFGKVGKINSEILSSKFGVGNSQFRTEGKSGYVDTVPFGAFKRQIFEKVGLFDSDLPRSEDNDINSRIRAAGGKVFLASDIRFRYFCRDTVGGLLNQGIKNGNALFLTLKKNTKAMSLRHFVPFLFVLSLIVMPILSFFSQFFILLFALELSAYTLLNVFFSFFYGEKKYFIYKIVLYPLFHIVYGIGSLLGIFNIKLY